MSAQYQSFPDAPGDSMTLEKLKALRLPPLAGKRFLDIGCNEGFFCGYAAFDGAARVVGLDRSATFLARARARFPTCEFLNQSWDMLPDGPFDVILLASAIHYADDQEALIHALVDRLAPEGTLVLELGVAPGAKDEWVRVERGIDARLFPTMAKLDSILARYAYKHMGPSVAQKGDPIKRHVVHVRRRRPFAYLLMEPPAYGKSTIARTLFGPAGVPVVSGDRVIQRIAVGALDAPEALAKVVGEEFSGIAIDRVLARVVEAGLGDALLRVLFAQAGGGSFALDAYWPEALHADVERIAREEGYLPVRLRWSPAGPLPPARAASTSRAEAYFASLGKGAPVQGAARARGHVDAIVPRDTARVLIRGWAFDAEGKLPASRAPTTTSGEPEDGALQVPMRRAYIPRDRGVCMSESRSSETVHRWCTIGRSVA